MTLTLVRIFLTIKSLYIRSARGILMIISKLTTKAQTTIPQPVRAALKLKPGDELVYEIEGSRVTLTKVAREATKDDPFGTFDEWHSKADAKAYAKL